MYVVIEKNKKSVVSRCLGWLTDLDVPRDSNLSLKSEMQQIEVRTFSGTWSSGNIKEWGTWICNVTDA